jgi:membrane fusion protein (multidrug efflux system)
VLVDEGTDTQTVRAEFPNPDALLTDGQFGRVIVETGKSEEAVVIPQVALQVDQAGTFVLVVDDQNKVQVRRVAVGQSREGMVAVRDGLTGGERVVTEGMQKVRPGQTVQPSAATSQGA